MTEERASGVMSDTVVRLFGRGEAFDSEGFIGFFTDKPMYQFGNGEPCLNKAAIKASVDNFFGSVAALYHDIRNLWEVGDVVFVEMDVTYWRKDGTSITLPCCDIFRFQGDQVAELRIFMDANPVFDKSMVVSASASVMTVSEGKRVVPPGTMRKYFAEHPEGIARATHGFPPKWSIAGPKWPITVPKAVIVDAFEAAIRVGNSELFKSYLTEDALLQIGNRAEVTGPQPIWDYLMKLFSSRLLISGVTAKATWEIENLYIMEMDVKGARVRDGKPVEYPCVETYRFRDNKLSEWRIYPLEPELLADESLISKA
jgi:ketosteroid isomerase-like protein